MSPLLQRTLKEKALRRARLMALPYPEKVRIVEKMRTAARKMHAAGQGRPTLREEPPACGSKMP